VSVEILGVHDVGFVMNGAFETAEDCPQAWPI
jgi:hypothetical protein